MLVGGIHHVDIAHCIHCGPLAVIISTLPRPCHRKLVSQTILQNVPSLLWTVQRVVPVNMAGTIQLLYDPWKCYGEENNRGEGKGGWMSRHRRISSSYFLAECRKKATERGYTFVYCVLYFVACLVSCIELWVFFCDLLFNFCRNQLCDFL